MINYIPVGEFDWGSEDKIGPMFELTCKNHPLARYLTKNPWLRSLHFVKAHDPATPYTECPCPFGDMVVVVGVDEAVEEEQGGIVIREA